MKKQSLFFVPGIILIGVSLRTPFTVLPIILGDISQGLGVEVSSLGILTSLPLLMFTLFSLFSTRLAQKIGLDKTRKQNIDDCDTCPNHQGS